MERVRMVLEGAPQSWAPGDLGGPASYSYRELAKLAYGTTEEPTAAQVVAVKRAVGVLVAGGQALRRGGRGGRKLVSRALSEDEQQALDALVAENRRRLGLSPRPPRV